MHCKSFGKLISKLVYHKQDVDYGIAKKVLKLFIDIVSWNKNDI